MWLKHTIFFARMSAIRDFFAPFKFIYVSGFTMGLANQTKGAYGYGQPDGVQTI